MQIASSGPVMCNDKFLRGSLLAVVKLENSQGQYMNPNDILYFF